MKLSFVKSAAKTRLLLVAVFCSLLIPPQNAAADSLTRVIDGVITGIAVPVAGETLTAVTNAGEYTGTVVWSDMDGEIPPDSTFEADVTYMATITLAAAAGYTFELVPDNFFTVDGATSVSFVFGYAPTFVVVTAVFDPIVEDENTLNLSDIIDQSFGPNGNGIFDVRDFFGKNPLTANDLIAGPVSVDRIALDSQNRTVVLASFKVDAAGTAIGTGYRNSINIAAQFANVAESTAAIAAREYTSTVSGNSYSDWYLPSKGELAELYSKRSSLLQLELNLEGDYWSSTEQSAGSAWGLDFFNGESFSHEKGNGYLVRPIRAGTVADPVIGAQGPGGGTIFYTSVTPFDCGPKLSLECNYLEAAPSNWSGDPQDDPGMSWSTERFNNQDTSLADETGDGIGDGYRNSNRIMAQSGNVASSSAAVASRLYRGGGKNDWHLPSKSELNELCKWAIGQVQNSNEELCLGWGNATPQQQAPVDFDANGFWSSSEAGGPSTAWIQSFETGVQVGEDKYEIHSVKPIRAGSLPTPVVGATGPGGGKIFYTTLSPFECGPAFEFDCNYLEVAPSDWLFYFGDSNISWATNNSNQANGIGVDNHILFRLNPDGSYDEEFGTPGLTLRKESGDDPKPYVLVTPTSIFYAQERVELVIDLQNRILVMLSGSLPNSNSGEYHNLIARFLNTGVIDSTFGENGVIGSLAAQYGVTETSSFFTDFDLDPSVLGGIVVASFPFFEPESPELVIQKFTALGLADTNFGMNGRASIELTSGLISDFPSTMNLYMNLKIVPDQNSGYLVAYSNFSLGDDLDDGALIFTQLIRFTIYGELDEDFQMTFSVPMSDQIETLTDNVLENFILTDLAQDGSMGFLLSGTYINPGGDLINTNAVVLRLAKIEGNETLRSHNMAPASNWDSQGCTNTALIRISDGSESGLGVMTGDLCMSALAGESSIPPSGALRVHLPSGVSYFTINLDEATWDNFQLQLVSQILRTSDGEILILRGARVASGWLAVVEVLTNDSDEDSNSSNTNWTTPTISRLTAGGSDSAPTELSFTGAEGLDARVGDSISLTLQTEGGVGAKIFELNTSSENGVLPPGLTLSPDGLISGTVTTPGTTFTSFKVTDERGNEAFWFFEFYFEPASSSVSSPPVAPPAPKPIPYLRTLTTPKKNLKDGKLICTPGTYNAGFTLNGVVQGSTTSLFTPATFTYNLIINGIAQISLAVTSANPSNSWDMPSTTSGTLITCSVTITANGVTNTDRSSDNAAVISAASITQGNAITTANTDYSATLNANAKAYQKALVDNRAQWRKEITAIRANYYEVLARINSEGSSRKMISDKSTALKIMIAAQKKSAADYKASQPTAFAAKSVADKAALDAKTAAIAKANATYGTFIESVGYGVLIP